MKKFYIIFFVSFIALSVLLYISSLWFLAGVAIIVFITTYQFYNSRLQTYTVSIEELESRVEELQKQLDRSLVKEEKASCEVIQIRQLKKQLLASLSHEIRTPMNAVLSMSLLLGDTTLTKEQTECVDTIKKAGDNLIKAIDEILVNDVLEYSKLDSRDKKIEPVDFDLRDTLEEVVDMFVTIAAKKNIELLLDIDDNIDSQLAGDNRRLREILMNMVENAVKFTQQGQVLINVHSLNKNENEPIIRFEVIDTGTGMTGEQIKHLFYASPARGFEKDKKPHRGLVICGKHASLMGGKIEVNSLPGRGSTFIFTVQFKEGKKIFIQEQQTILNLLEGKKILIVDDNAASRNIISRQLKNWGMLPTSASSALQALQVLENDKNFDLVLVDLHMPQMDGLQFSRTAKKSYTDLPFVLLNSAWDESYKNDLGLFAGIFSKPLKQNVFRDNMIAFFQHNNQQQKNEQLDNKNDFASAYPLKILVAEDNQVNQKIAIKILSNLGYNIEIANNGKEAIESLAHGHYDLILMDVQMPEMDGLEATKLIRSEKKIQPVIIALTANVLQGDHDACIQAGMNDYLSKPIILDELKNKLEKWFAVINQPST